jgi:hypothetical protein
VRVLRAWPLLAVAALVQCSRDKDRAAPVTSASSTASAVRDPPSTDDEVQSVYPLDSGAPDPLAQRLCAALHDLPEQRRAECCSKKPGVVFTGECVRMLTAAIHFKAVSLDAGDVDRCSAAMSEAYGGCEWVGPWPPETPAACAGIVHGVLATGARCRSSLECSEGLHCHGAGPTSAGVCGMPRDEGQACGTAVDSLATYTKQERTQRAHPACKGYCDHSRCAAPIPIGGACKSDDQCADASCGSRTCAPHHTAKLGEPCPTGECEPGARCLDGTCISRRPSGSTCTSAFECLGDCLKSDGGRGVCGPRCDLR